MKKRILGILLALSLMIPAMPVMAAEPSEPQETVRQEGTREEDMITEYWINPIYEGIFTEDDIRTLSADDELFAASDNVVLNSDAEAVEYLKSQLKARNTVISFSTTTPLKYGVEELLNAAMDESVAAGSDEGDYIRSHFSGASMEYSPNGTYFKYTVSYLSTAGQEAEVAAAIEKALAELGISGKSDYQKVKAIHDYIVNHVVYLFDDQNQCYSAYGAIINGKAVCQGYASLFYRMCREAGIPARIITGLGNGGAHAWNIVKLGDYWYNVDVTWDDPITNTGQQILRHTYFLKSEADFGDHDREEPYNTEDFYREYPMSPVSYDESMDPGPMQTPTPGINPDPTPTPGTDPAPIPTSTPGTDPTPIPTSTPGTDPIPGPTATPAPDKDWTFTDVKVIPGNWKYENIRFVNEKGIMTGVKADQFKPDDQLTRAQFASVIYRLAGSPQVSYRDIFSDVPAGKWYSNAIIWAYENKIVAGLGEGRYGIDDNITREQMARMLMELVKVQQYDTSDEADFGRFEDASQVSRWAAENMRWAVGAGIISGSTRDGKYYMNPKGEATRAECAVMLTKFVQKYQ